MYIEFVLILTLSMLLEIGLQRLWITKMHDLKIEQVTKLYGPAWHEKTKTGTPTMGGFVFFPVYIVSMAAAFFLNNSIGWHTLLAVALYPGMSAAVGFADDWIKYRKRGSDGLKSLEKLALQILITLPWVMWVLPDTLELWPEKIYLGRVTSVALVTFAAVGFQNAVNVTDGLDGLATTCMLVSFVGATIFLNSSPAVFLTLASACGICLGFLWHNSNPASVFMGDVGAHFLASLLVAVCVVSNAFILLIPFGFIFGIEIISVALQIFSLRFFKKRIFLMSPIHHHFEMKGWSENQIVTRFWIVHALGMMVLILLLFLITALA